MKADQSCWKWNHEALEAWTWYKSLELCLYIFHGCCTHNQHTWNVNWLWKWGIYLKILSTSYFQYSCFYMFVTFIIIFFPWFMNFVQICANLCIYCMILMIISFCGIFFQIFSYCFDFWANLWIFLCWMMQLFNTFYKTFAIFFNFSTYSF